MFSSLRSFYFAALDQEGIKLFAFHGKINEEMNGREGGTFSRDILKAKNGRWTFYDANARLKEGDILYYWTYVDYFDGKNKLGYPNDDQKFVVKQLLDKDGAAPSVTPPTVTKAPPQEHTTLESGCKASVTTKVNERVCAGEQIFHEDFTTFETNIWRPEVKFADKPVREEFFCEYCNNSNFAGLRVRLLQGRSTESASETPPPDDSARPFGRGVRRGVREPQGEGEPGACVSGGRRVAFHFMEL
jgi:hypothetical protein